MRYLFKRLDQQTTTIAHPQWAMGTHRSAPCLHLDGLVTHLDTLIFFEFPLSVVHELTMINLFDESTRFNTVFMKDKSILIATMLLPF